MLNIPVPNNWNYFNAFMQHLLLRCYWSRINDQCLQPSTLEGKLQTHMYQYNTIGESSVSGLCLLTGSFSTIHVAFETAPTDMYKYNAPQILNWADIIGKKKFDEDEKSLILLPNWWEIQSKLQKKNMTVSETRFLRLKNICMKIKSSFLSLLWASH